MKQHPTFALLFVLTMFTNLKVFSYDFKVNEIYYNYNPSEQTAIVTFGDEKYSGEVVIPSSITYNGRQLDIKSIGYKAFYQCTELRSVYLPNSIVTISDEAFRGCETLDSIKMSDYIEEIGEEVFVDCRSMRSINLPNSLRSIGMYAFSNTGLKSIRIPKSVISIGGAAYAGCTDLKTIVFEDSNEIVIFGTGTLGGGFSNIFSNVKPEALYWGRPIQDRYFSRDYEFASSMVTLTIGNYMKEQEDFERLSENLRGMYIDRTETIKTVYSTSENPMDISEWCFHNKVYLNAKLYVPIGTKNKYMSSQGWKNFFQIEEMDIDKMWNGQGNPNDDIQSKQKCERPTISYTNGKLFFRSATDGATCQSSITDSDISSFSGNEVQLTVTYTVSVYATASGYENSDVATATLCWIDVDPKTEGIENGIAQVRANAVLIQSHDGTLSITGVAEGTDIVVYSVSGQMVGSAKARGEHSTIATNLCSGDVAIVRIGDRSVKVVMQ